MLSETNTVSELSFIQAQVRIGASIKAMWRVRCCCLRVVTLFLFLSVAFNELQKSRNPMS